MTLRLTTRGVRLGLAMGLLGLFLWAIDPGVLHPMSMAGKVNADLITVRAPIEGVVTFGPLRTGDDVSADRVVATIANAREDSTRLGDLTAELRDLAQRREILEQQRDRLAGVRARLEAQAADFQDATLKSLDTQIHEARARIRSAEATAANATAQFARTAALLSSGYVSRAQYDQRRADRDAAVGNGDVAREELVRLERLRAAAAKGIFLGDNFNDVPYSQQRRDDVGLRIIAVDREIAELVTQQRRVQEQITTEERRRERRLSANVVAPAEGIAWRLVAGSGEYVPAGAALMQIADCSRIFFDVDLGSRSFNRLAIGDRVQVHIDGFKSPLPGRVAALRGGADTATHGFALNLVPDRQEQVQWIVDIDWSSVRGGPQSACPIGRSGRIVRAPGVLAWLFSGPRRMADGRTTSSH